MHFIRSANLVQVALPILFLVHCSTSQKKASMPPELSESTFRYTANDTDNCAVRRVFVCRQMR
jgi:hypothetical protein